MLLPLKWSNITLMQTWEWSIRYPFLAILKDLFGGFQNKNGNQKNLEISSPHTCRRRSSPLTHPNQPFQAFCLTISPIVLSLFP